MSHTYRKRKGTPFAQRASEKARNPPNIPPSGGEVLLLLLLWCKSRSSSSSSSQFVVPYSFSLLLSFYRTGARSKSVTHRQKPTTVFEFLNPLGVGDSPPKHVVRNTSTISRICPRDQEHHFDRTRTETTAKTPLHGRNLDEHGADNPAYAAPTPGLNLG